MAEENRVSHSLFHSIKEELIPQMALAEGLICILIGDCIGLPSCAWLSAAWPFPHDLSIVYSLGFISFRCVRFEQNETTCMAQNSPDGVLPFTHRANSLIHKLSTPGCQIEHTWFSNGGH